MFRRMFCRSCFWVRRGSGSRWFLHMLRLFYMLGLRRWRAVFLSARRLSHRGSFCMRTGSYYPGIVILPVKFLCLRRMFLCFWRGLYSWFYWQGTIDNR